MKHAFAIGVFTAIVLTFIRGGSVDSIWIPIAFGIAGFLGTLLISYLVRRDPLNNNEVLTAQNRSAPWIRDVVALSISASFVIWAGPLAFRAMYAGWLVAIFLVIAGSLLVCLIAVHWPIVFGVLVATAIDVSLLLQNARWKRAHGNLHFWDDFWNGECKVFLGIWAFLAGLSLVVSIPIHIKRHRNKLS